ncbi:hypothetical protein OUZ56_016999 [Daphnia magna]|uniref:Uncharacterized protein n=1 Tax=Daphnia magna TaxID=35525 RepID=A0ABR0ARW0_9CRUS|nr:hypothetical protein OUZ56_016999 [Daphnia magna]
MRLPTSPGTSWYHLDGVETLTEGIAEFSTPQPPSVNLSILNLFPKKEFINVIVIVIADARQSPALSGKGGPICFEVY